MVAHGEPVRVTYGAGPTGHLTGRRGDPRQKRASSPTAGIPDQPDPVPFGGSGASLQRHVRKATSRSPGCPTIGTPAGKTGCRLRMPSVDAFVSVSGPDRSPAVGHQSRDVVADAEGCLLVTTFQREHHGVRAPRSRLLLARSTACDEKSGLREKSDVARPDRDVLDRSPLKRTVSLANHEHRIEWDLRAPAHPTLHVTASA